MDAAIAVSPARRLELRPLLAALWPVGRLSRKPRSLESVHREEKLWREIDWRQEEAMNWLSIRKPPLAGF